MTNPPAVLLGGQTMAVSVARSLGRRGIPVFALGDPLWDSVGHSRFCTRFVDLGGTDVDLRLEWLERDGPHGGVLLPCDDDGLELVARHRAAITELGYTTIEPRDDVLLAMLDKERTYELARAADVPAPRTVLLRDAADVAAAAEQIGFPCALKPVHVHHHARHFPDVKVWTTRDAAELREILERTDALGLELLVTEIVPGGDDVCSYFTYMDEAGEPLFHFTKRKLRQFPIHFGIGTYHVGEWLPDVAELGLAFFRSIGLRGLGQVEFKRDARDGRYVLLDCNLRFTGATELLRLSGLDLALFTYNRLLARPVPPLGRLRGGLRLWLPVEDARAFLAYRRSGELTTREWLGSLLHRQHFPLLSLDDPKPALAAWAKKAQRLRGRLQASPR